MGNLELLTVSGDYISPGGSVDTTCILLVIQRKEGGSVFKVSSVLGCEDNLLDLGLLESWWRHTKRYKRVFPRLFDLAFNVLAFRCNISVLQYYHILELCLMVAWLMIGLGILRSQYST